MTLLEILLFMSWIAVAAGAGVVGWNFFGGVGMLVGGTAGLLLAPVAVAGLHRLFPFRPRRRPICPNGICEDEHYEWTRGIQGRPVCQCRCGLSFVEIGDRFMQVGDSDATIPFMKWDRKEGWVHDQ